ncbi:Uncharacterised protein [Sarcina ventriculi]|uniref:hypothetical protein n=1 Tax=Sarcina ventriculi TaxID=1267 RepID=UPI000D8650DF|nr:hypothetical protein [Sarcina ventriculi]SPZ51231.1 Uncharacterised protein [Sarcina ventriculi]
MATSLRRFSISIPADIEKELDTLKQKEFYNKTQSEMLRHLIRLGVEASKEKER